MRLCGFGFDFGLFLWCFKWILGYKIEFLDFWDSAIDKYMRVIIFGIFVNVIFLYIFGKNIV